MDVVVTTGSIRRVKLQSNHHHQLTNTQLSTGQMPFLSPNHVKALKRTHKRRWFGEIHLEPGFDDAAKGVSLFFRQVGVVNKLLPRLNRLVPLGQRSLILDRQTTRYFLQHVAGKMSVQLTRRLILQGSCVRSPKIQGFP